MTFTLFSKYQLTTACNARILVAESEETKMTTTHETLREARQAANMRRTTGELVAVFRVVRHFTQPNFGTQTQVQFVVATRGTNPEELR
jgi:hypothetical protein